MKYSIKGNIHTTDGSDIIKTINNYSLWRLITGSYKDIFKKIDIFTFEAWVDTIEDKNFLLNDLRTYVDNFGGSINWHECTHDESVPKPCAIAEEYRK